MILRLLVFLSLAALLWHCELNEPSKPPLHRIGEEVFNGTPYETDTVVDYRRSPVETLSKVLDSTYRTDREQRPGYDTLVVRYARIRFEAVQFTRRRDLITPRENCTMDSGVAGNTAPPVKLGCKPLEPSIANLESRTLVDTNWLDTLYESITIPPLGGPVILTPGVNMVNGKWRTSLIYPDTALPMLPLANPVQENLTLVSSSWQGTSRFTTSHDSLQLIWPSASRLGTLTGTLTVKGEQSQLVTTLPYESSRHWVGLVPQGSTLETYWTLALGKTAALVPDAEFRRFSMEAHAPNRDSILALRSRFKLVGDFRVSIRFTLPPTADSGCTLAWYFAPPDITPFVEYQGGTRTSAARLNLYTEGVGFYVNTTGRLNPPITLLRTGEALQINQLQGNKSFPKEAILLAIRRGQTLNLSVCDVTANPTAAIGSATAPGCSEMATLTPLQGENRLEDALQMHLFVGGFGKAAFQVMWQDLTISEGVLAP